MLGATFEYAPAGHREYSEGPKAGRRNVHAWVYGQESLEQVDLSKGWRPCRYSQNPPCFVDMQTKQCLPNDRSIDVYLGSKPNVEYTIATRKSKPDVLAVFDTAQEAEQALRAGGYPAKAFVLRRSKPSKYEHGKAVPWAPTMFWRPSAAKVRNPDAMLEAIERENLRAAEQLAKHNSRELAVLASIARESGWDVERLTSSAQAFTREGSRLFVMQRGKGWYVEVGPVLDPTQAKRGYYGGTVARVLEGPDGKRVHVSRRAAFRTAAKFMRLNATKVRNPYIDKFIPPGGKGYQYVYSEEDVALRHAKKAQRIEALKHKEAQLRQAIERDVAKGDDTALAAGLILATYERPGNPESAKEGHYGVTGWECRHLSVDGRKAVIDYIGKSGVHQTKEVDNPTLVRALSRKAKGCTRRGGKLMRVSASAVNRYLDSFDISSKDLRTFGANTEMQKELRLARRAGPDLSTLKSRDVRRVLKAEFNAALGVVAGRLGHTTSVLRKQYLVSSIEPTYLESGSIVQTFA